MFLFIYINSLYDWFSEAILRKRIKQDFKLQYDKKKVLDSAEKRKKYLLEVKKEKNEKVEVIRITVKLTTEYGEKSKERPHGNSREITSKARSSIRYANRRYLLHSKWCIIYDHRKSIVIYHVRVITLVS